MKTVNELKKCPQHALRELINLEVINERTERETQLNTDFLERHSALTRAPDYIQNTNKTLSLHFVIGGLQALLKIAIMDIQRAEIELERNEDQLKDALKMSI